MQKVLGSDRTRLLCIMLMAVLMSIHVNAICFRPQTRADSQLLPPVTAVMLGPLTVSAQMHEQLHLLWAQQSFQVCLPPLKQACVQKIKKYLYITLPANGANQPRDVTRGGTARWQHPCSKSYNKTSFFL